MAKFNASNDLEKYATSGGYFSLKEDKDTALVRFMYNTEEDIEGHVVHRVEVNGYNRYVNCLRSYSDPLDACPLCEAHMRTTVKFYVPLYKIDTDEVLMWERGQNFYSKLHSLCMECKPLVSYPVEIERNGKAGDMNTTYELYPQEEDGTMLDDLPEIPNPLGTTILDKTYDELVTFVQTGSFDTNSNPVTDNANIQDRRNRSVPVNNNNNGVARRRRTAF